MRSDLIVRVGTAADAPALAWLNIAFNGGEETAERIAARMADPRCVETPVLAEIDGVAVGFAALRVVPCIFYAEPYAELTELYVEPGYRRRGVGKALVAYAEQLAQQAGAAGLVVLTSLDNRVGQAFYGAVGYLGDDLAFTKDWQSN